VVEAISLLRQRFGGAAARRFINDNLPALTILWVDEFAHTAAIALMLTQGRNGPSLVDCSSFILMQEHHITQACAFDAHFTKQGY
jgi:predicted nucleic acid-binding protein